MKNKFIYLAFLSLFLLFSSCSSKKEVIYLQFDEINQDKVSNNYSLKFKPDDLLQIVVSSEDIMSAQPFNLPVVAFATPNSQTFVSQPQLQSYLIDSKGEIDFPILGKLKIANLTRPEAIEMIINKLSPEYINNPIVNITLMNFKITVQGDVARPGTFTIPSERVSIFDALGLAGDLNISANRQDITVVREENQKKNIYKVDIRSKKILTSPVYYLQQNDVVYVEPNSAKIQDAAYTRNAGLFISLAS